MDTDLCAEWFSKVVIHVKHLEKETSLTNERLMTWSQNGFTNHEETEFSCHEGGPG